MVVVLVVVIVVFCHMEQVNNFYCTLFMKSIYVCMKVVKKHFNRIAGVKEKDNRKTHIHTQT